MILKRTFIAFIASLCLAGPVLAQSTAPDMSDVVQVDLLKGWKKSNGDHVSAVRIRLAEGWKTYWRSPGGDGIPPVFNWNTSENLKSVKIIWPSPTLFNSGGSRSVGYKKQLILPIEFTPKDPSKPVKIDSQLNFGVCKELCIPVTVQLQQALSSQAAEHRNLIEKAIATRPMSAKKGGIRSVACTFKKTSNGFLMTASIKTARNTKGPVHAVFELPTPNVWIQTTPPTIKGKVITATAEIFPYDKNNFFLDRSRLRMTILKEGRAVEIIGCAS